MRLEESFAPSADRAQEEPADRVLEASSSSPVATTPLIRRPRPMAEVVCARASPEKGLLAVRSGPPVIARTLQAARRAVVDQHLVGVPAVLQEIGAHDFVSTRKTRVLSPPRVLRG